MSIRNRQIEIRLEEFIHDSVSEGHLPSYAELQSKLSAYFARFPIGQPKASEILIPTRSVSDPEAINDVIRDLAEDLEILFDELLDQVDELTETYQGLDSLLDRVRTRRKQLTTDVENYLHSLFNLDGYFYAIIDNLSELTYTDTDFTTAHVDTKLGVAYIPIRATGSERLGSENISLSLAAVFDPDKSPGQEPTEIDNDLIRFKAGVVSGANAISIDTGLLSSAHGFTTKELYPFSGAVDGLTNTAWAIDVSSRTAKKMTCGLVLDVNEDFAINQIELVPFSSKATKMWIKYNHNGGIKSFGNIVHTSTDPIVFTHTPTRTNQIIIWLQKDQPDYYDINNNRYRYLVGLKEISLMSLDFDEVAEFVSTPLSLPVQMSQTHAIGSVSLEVDSIQPEGTQILYYIAPSPADDGATPFVPNEIEEFEWVRINPVTSDDEDAPTVIDMDGARDVVIHAREEPVSEDEIEMIPENTTSDNLSERNPNPSIIEGKDIWRLFKVDGTPLKGTSYLEEGVNAIKVYHTDLDADALSLDWWFGEEDDTQRILKAERTFIELDKGYSFFYGGAVGSAEKSCYVESILVVDDDVEITAPIQKIDQNSKTWDVKVYLNEEEIVHLPTGTDQVQALWSLRAGRNRIVALVNIPPISGESPLPYLGSLELMPNQITRIGTLKLGDWREVDVFDLANNELGEPDVFAFHDGEVVSLKRPAPNMRLRFKQGTGVGPEFVRFRARLEKDPGVQATPMLDKWKVRFGF